MKQNCGSCRHCKFFYAVALNGATSTGFKCTNRDSIYDDKAIKKSFLCGRWESKGSTSYGARKHGS